MMLTETPRLYPDFLPKTVILNRSTTYTVSCTQIPLLTDVINNLQHLNTILSYVSCISLVIFRRSLPVVK
jgi:hypothetical protein